MSERYTGHHADIDTSGPTVMQECFDFVDPVFAEQIQLSLRVMAEASTLPPAMVAYHQGLLEYWGVYDTDTT